MRLLTDFSPFSVEFDEVEPRSEEAANINMASCSEAVVDSGVDSEATTPSSPEDDSHEEEVGKHTKDEDTLSDEMVLETAETLLALSGKKTKGGNKIHEIIDRPDTAVVFPEQPDTSHEKGTELHLFNATPCVRLLCS